MNGQKTNCNDYDSGLIMCDFKVPKAKLDLRGAIKYAKEKGVPVGDLSRAEKDMFIEYLEDPSGYDLP